MSGANNSPQPTQYTSSFSCLDALVTAVTNRMIFPNVNLVVVAGFSAGGQTVNRYSWATSINYNSAASNWHMRFIASDPSSYAYLNGSRPASSCYPFRNTGINHTCSQFVSNTTAMRNCSDYNEWKYGVGSFPTSGYLYFLPFLSNTTRKYEQNNEFRLKDIRFIIGAIDVCNCNLPSYSNQATCYPRQDSLSCTPDAYGGPHCCDTYPDSTTSNAVANECEANLQGSNRLQRGMNFFSYLEWYWQEFDYKVIFTTVPGMAHNSTAFYLSPQFHQWAFETPPPSPQSHNGLTAAAIAMIVASIIAVVAMAVALCYHRYLATKSNPESTMSTTKSTSTSKSTSKSGGQQEMVQLEIKAVYALESTNAQVAPAVTAAPLSAERGDKSELHRRGSAFAVESPMHNNSSSDNNNSSSSNSSSTLVDKSSKESSDTVDNEPIGAEKEEEGNNVRVSEQEKEEGHTSEDQPPRQESENFDTSSPSSSSAV